MWARPAPGAVGAGDPHDADGRPRCRRRSSSQAPRRLQSADLGRHRGPGCCTGRARSRRGAAGTGLDSSHGPWRDRRDRSAVRAHWSRPSPVGRRRRGAGHRIAHRVPVADVGHDWPRPDSDQHRRRRARPARHRCPRYSRRRRRSPAAADRSSGGSGGSTTTRPSSRARRATGRVLRRHRPPRTAAVVPRSHPRHAARRRDHRRGRRRR